MVKARVAPPKCFIHVATPTKKDRYTLIAQSANLALLKFAFTNTIQLNN